MKGLVETVLSESGWDDAAVNVPVAGALAEDHFVPASSVALMAGDGTSVGAAGQVRPDRFDAPAWASQVWAMELKLPSQPVSETKLTYRPLSPFPGVDRDLALLVPYDVSTSAVSHEIRGVGGELLERVTVFDLYRGDGVAEGHRSLGFRLRLQAWDRTLKDKEVDRVVEKIVKRLREGLGVEQRL